MPIMKIPGNATPGKVECPFCHCWFAREYLIKHVDQHTFKNDPKVNHFPDAAAYVLERRNTPHRKKDYNLPSKCPFCPKPKPLTRSFRDHINLHTKQDSKVKYHPEAEAFLLRHPSKHRRLKKNEVDILMREFENNATPTAQSRERLAKDIGVELKLIYVRLEYRD